MPSCLLFLQVQRVAKDQATKTKMQFQSREQDMLHVPSTCA
jgi:hypothetical protein